MQKRVRLAHGVMGLFVAAMGALNVGGLIVFADKVCDQSGNKCESNTWLIYSIFIGDLMLILLGIALGVVAVTVPEKEQ